MSDGGKKGGDVRETVAKAVGAEKWDRFAEETLFGAPWGEKGSTAGLSDKSETGGGVRGSAAVCARGETAKVDDAGGASEEILRGEAKAARRQQKQMSAERRQK